MGFVAFSALRYLFGRSRLGAAGWISLISAIAIAVVTAALVCVLSVYNGYVALLVSGEARCLPELMITPRIGKSFDADTLLQTISPLTEIVSHSKVLQSQGVLRTNNSEAICDVYGVDKAYKQVVPIDSGLIEGYFLSEALSPPEKDSINEEEKRSPACLGFALASKSLFDNDSLPPTLLFPRREGLINPLAVSSGFVEVPLNLTGILPPYNESVNQRIYIQLKDLQEALNYNPSIVSGIALRLRTGEDLSRTQQKLQNIVGPSYLVQNREEQQPELTLLIKTEKVMVYVIMLFILVLATFNLASSLAMLIMEKEQDIQTFRSLGAGRKQVSLIFALTGLLTSMIGSITGLIIGLGFCLLQQTFGFITSGQGVNQMTFPIDLQWQDLIYIILATFVVASLSAGIPAGLINKRHQV